MTWVDEDVVFVVAIIGMIVAACVAYLMGYWDGYHAGAVIYMGGQP